MKTGVLVACGVFGLALIVTACGATRASGFSDPVADDDGGGPGLVGGGSLGDAPPPGCRGLECSRVRCAGGRKTTLSGTVYAPTPARFGKADPIYNAIVYVPNGDLEPFPGGVTCDQCGAVASGQPITTALSGPNGAFVLDDVPAGDDIPLVVQVGRWRRLVKVPTVTACEDTPLDAELTRLPRSKSEGDIPRMAIVTSIYDGIECLMRKIGVADEEFTEPDGDGRVHLYQGLGATLPLPARPPSGERLWGSAEALARYDVVALPCGSQPTDAAGRRRIADYADAGGRVFVTDLSQDVIKDGPDAWRATANFSGAGAYDDPATIDRSFPKGAALADWLELVGASPMNGLIDLVNTFGRVRSVNPPSQRWIHSSATTQTYSFNTPVGADPTAQCGRAIFSSFHVTTGAGGVFPSACSNQPMTPQEKALEFMLFDLSACIQDDGAAPTPPPIVK